MTYQIPRAFFSESLLPSLVLTRENSTVYKDFPSNFTYLEPPTPLVRSVVPSATIISKATYVFVVISDFPPVSVLSDIVVIFSWSYPNKSTAATVNRFDMLNQTSQNLIQINISSPTGTSSRAEPAVLTIYHSLFSQSKSVFTGFLFEDLSRPKLTKIQLVGTSAGQKFIRISLNNRQPIFLSFDDVPANFEDIQCSAELEGNQLNISSSAYTPVAMSAMIALSTGQAMSTGIKTGIFIFGTQSANYSCSSSCCADDSCSEQKACGNLKTACFWLEYFDDTLPFVINQPKTLG